MNKTTEKHFRIFKKEAEFWLDKFGLKEWRMEIMHRDSAELGECRAWFSTTPDMSSGTLNLAKNWGSDKITEEGVRSAALHEVLHVLFCPMGAAANERHVACGQFELEEHKVIRRMENLFFDERGR